MVDLVRDLVATNVSECEYVGAGFYSRIFSWNASQAGKLRRSVLRPVKRDADQDSSNFRVTLDPGGEVRRVHGKPRTANDVAMSLQKMGVSGDRITFAEWNAE